MQQPIMKKLGLEREWITFYNLHLTYYIICAFG